MNKAKELSIICNDDDKQWKNVVEWARRNPTKTADVLALDMDERDRIRSRITFFNGGNPPLNVRVEVKPQLDTTPVRVRVEETVQ